MFRFSISLALLSRSIFEASERLSSALRISPSSFSAFAWTGTKIELVSFSSQPLISFEENFMISVNDVSQ